MLEKKYEEIAEVIARRDDLQNCLHDIEYDLKKCNEELVRLCSDVASVGLDEHEKFKKEVVDDGTKFSSRFMPNVKCIAPYDVLKSLKTPIDIEVGKYSKRNYVCAEKVYGIHFSNALTFQENFAIPDQETYDSLCIEEVSIYEAIPELVPDGMRYNKGTDELVSKAVCSADFKYVDADEIHKDIIGDISDQEVVNTGANFSVGFKNLNEFSEYFVPKLGENISTPKEIEDACVRFSDGDIVVCKKNIHGFNTGDVAVVSYIGEVMLGCVKKDGVVVGAYTFSMERFTECFEPYFE